MRIGLYLSGKKGFYTLKALTDLSVSSNIAAVAIGRDQGLREDSTKTSGNWRTRGRPIVAEDEISAQDADWRLAVGWRTLLQDTRNLVILHDSLLPKYRGFIPWFRLFARGAGSWLTPFWGDDQDRGDILAQRSLEIEYTITAQEAIDALLPLYAEIVTEIIEYAVRGFTLPHQVAHDFSRMGLSGTRID